MVIETKKTLRGVKPEVVPASRPKMILSGKAGVGKSWTAIEFPAVYYLDTEGGVTQPHYRKKLSEAGGIYFGKEQGSQDFATVIEEIKTLVTTEHPFKTLVIDSFSKLFNIAKAQAELQGGSEFGRDKKEAIKPTRQLMMWLDKLDMNVILICHAADKWERLGKQPVYAGTTFDGWEKLEYDLDLWLEITFKDNKRLAIVRKTRMEAFPLDTIFDWNYQEFSKKAGGDLLNKKASVYQIATASQVAEITRLVGVVKVDPDWKDKAFAKAGVNDWSEMSTIDLQKCIDKLQNLLGKEAK